MAAPSVTNTFTNGTTADATEVNQNFTDVINGITDGTKDLTISAFTANGAATFNGAVTLGNATGDDITITGRVASDIDPKTAATNTLGDATQTWRALYLDNTTTDSGTIYFDAGSTYNTAVLDVVGFTSLDLNTTADVVGGLHTYMAVNNGTIYDEGDPVYSFTGDTDTGMYSETGNELNFSTGGVERLAISATKGAVFNDGGADVDFRIESDGDANMFFLDAGNNTIGINEGAPAGTVTAPVVVQSNSYSGLHSHIVGFYRDGGAVYGSIGYNDTNTRLYIGSISAHPFAIRTSNVGRIVIDASGNVQFAAYGSGTLSTDASGNITASDARLKDETRQLDSGLDKVLKLKPKYYRWKEGSKFDSKYEELGFFAQEVQEAIPEAAPEPEEPLEKEVYKNYHDRALIAVLVKAVQELKAEVDELRAR
jgi:hypothetical protein